MRETPPATGPLKILRIFLIIFIPVIFMTTASWVFLKWSGYEPTAMALQWMDSVPVIGLVVDGSSEQEMTSEARVEKLINKTQEKTRLIQSLKAELSAAEQEIKQLKNQLERLETSYEKKLDKRMKLNEAAKYRVIADTYEKMSPQNAAAIFKNMDVEEAAKYLNLLDNETKAAVLAQMAPKTAAKIMPLLDTNKYEKE